MTNARIIFNESIAIMEKGILKPTNQKVVVEDENGEKRELFLPEQIHTFAVWKSLGRAVKRGEKAKASFPIWKMCKGKKQARESENGEESKENEHMYMCKAFWFTIDQTEEMKCRG